MRVTDGFFQGYALNAVDAKNRLSIPADFRDVILNRSGSKDLLIAPGHGGADCLLAYDRSYAAELSAEHKARFGATTERARFDEAHLLFGAASTFKIDDAGRIVLSATVKALGNLGAHVWFVAGGDWFEMWNPWAYLARPGLDPRIARILKAEMQARGLPDTDPAA
jgi:MraZ protein